MTRASELVLGIDMSSRPSASTRRCRLPRGRILLGVLGLVAAFAAPLVAGVMADGLGFPWVFAVATAGGLISLGLFIARVHDPRKGQES